MSRYVLGIDTSNYTTSVALINLDTNEVTYSRKLLPVKKGEAGIRQSEAVFHHQKQLPIVIKDLIKSEKYDIISIGVTNRPRNIEGSYMPCFMTGYSFAESLSYLMSIPYFTTSHQVNHILSALKGTDNINFTKKNFIAFHVSGGTTDCLIVSPDKDDIIIAEPFSSSLDLKAGQAIDRVGLMLGLSFPCGKELEKLAESSNYNFKEKIKLKENNCCLSGLENKCKKMIESGEKKEDTAMYCLSYIGNTIIKMTEAVREKYPEFPIIYSGGVMSDVIIQNMISSSIENAYFCNAEYSCDNAIGSAIFAKLKIQEIMKD